MSVKKLRIAEDFNCVLANSVDTRLLRTTFKRLCLSRQTHRMGFTGMHVKAKDSTNPCFPCRIGKQVHELHLKELKREELRAKGKKKKNWEARAAAKRMKIPAVPCPMGIVFMAVKEYDEIKKHLPVRTIKKRNKRISGPNKMEREAVL